MHLAGRVVRLAFGSRSMAPQPILLSPEAVAMRGIHIKPHEAAFRENSATIVMPSKEAAFLNPVQEFNRDLSTLSIISWSQMVDREKKQRYEAHLNAREAKRAKRDEPEAKRLKTEEEKAYRPYKFTALEALSATGLRSIRYAKEIPLLGSVLANDLSATAVQAMRRNLALNFPPGRPLEEYVPLQGEQEAAPSAPEAQEASTDAPDAASTDPQIHPDCKVIVNQGDAITLMYEHRDTPKRFDMVDLDPYGTASPFLDAAVQSVADGGLLCVTCTDLAVLAGHNYPEKCWSLYGGVSVKAEYSHEVALRLVLHAIATAAGKYGRYIQPMLSLSIDFYLRVFVRVWTRPETVKLNASKTGLVYSCSKCSDFHIQPMGRATSSANAKTGATNVKFGSASGPPTDMRCGECGCSFHVGGPMWFGPLHDPLFCDEVLTTLDSGKHKFGTEARIRGMVSTARDVRLICSHRNSTLRSTSTLPRSRGCFTARALPLRRSCTCLPRLTQPCPAQRRIRGVALALRRRLGQDERVAWRSLRPVPYVDQDEPRARRPPERRLGGQRPAVPPERGRDACDAALLRSRHAERAYGRGGARHVRVAPRALPNEPPGELGPRHGGQGPPQKAAPQPRPRRHRAAGAGPESERATAIG